MRRVLVTGMSGLIGAAVRRRLEGRYALRALNRRPVAGVECHQADIADFDAIAPAFAGVDAVVHLAANVEPSPSIEAIVRDNVVGTYNVFEAARRAGVRRERLGAGGAVRGAGRRPL
jgi:nucleoside-diphosphate-sugar epimerase